jgi:hypothetical protein
MLARQRNIRLGTWDPFGESDLKSHGMVVWNKDGVDSVFLRIAYATRKGVFVALEYDVT